MRRHSGVLTRRQLLRSGTMAAGLAGLYGAGLPLTAFAQDKPFSGRKLTHWSFLSPEGSSAREQAIKLNEQTFRETTGIEVNFEIYPWNEIARRVVQSAQAGNPPDVTRVPFESVQMVARAGALLPLDSYIDQTFPEDARSDFIVDFSPTLYVDDSKYNMQLETISYALFIRKDWLEEVGMEPPKTWADVVKFGKAVSDGKRWGYFYFAGKQMLVQTVYLQPHIRGRGGLVLNEDGTAAFNNDATVRAYEFLRDCVHVHKITPQEVVNMSWEDQTDAFRAGRVAMVIDGSHRYRDHAAAVGEDNILLVEIPSDDPETPSPTPVTGWGLGIPKGSSDPEAAWEYIKYYVSPEAQAISARVGGSLPSRKSALEDPWFDEPEAAYMRWWTEYSQAHSEPQIAVPTVNRLAEVMTNVLQQVILQPESDIAPLLDAAAREYNRILQQQN